MSSVILGIYISKLVPFAHGSYKSNTIEKVDALHTETVYQYFVIFITASLLDLTAGSQIFPKSTDTMMTSWLGYVFRSSGLSGGDISWD